MIALSVIKRKTKFFIKNVGLRCRSSQQRSMLLNIQFVILMIDALGMTWQAATLPPQPVKAKKPLPFCLRMIVNLLSHSFVVALFIRL